MMNEYSGNTCPCMSGKGIEKCCMQPDGRLHKPYSGVIPAAHEVGYAHPDCFLRESNDCSEKISAEHYISKSILNAIRGAEKLVKFGGAAWLPGGRERLLPPEALTCKMLCRRHNSMLHPLDDAALALVKSLVRTFDAELKGGGNSFTLASGHAFEAWAIKSAIGCIRSGTFADGNGASVKSDAVAPSALLPALRGEPLPQGCGLYMQVRLGLKVGGQPPFQMAPILMSHLGKRHIVGAEFAIFGVLFLVLFDPDGVPDDLEAQGWAYRPGIIQFSRPDFLSALALSWSDDKPHGSVDFSLTPSIPA